MDKSCPYNPNYGNCLKENCPGNSSTICTGAIAGQNACGENCKKCCDDSCPVGSKNYTGSFASKTECGNNCYNCNTACPSGSLAYSGDIVSYNECGQACRSCNTSCPSGTSTSNPGGCGGSTSDECNTKTCYYPFQACCDNSCEGDKSGQCPSGYREWTSTDGCGNTCYNCSCELVLLRFRLRGRFKRRHAQTKIQNLYHEQLGSYQYNPLYFQVNGRLLR